MAQGRKSDCRSMLIFVKCCLAEVDLSLKTKWRPFDSGTDDISVSIDDPTPSLPSTLSLISGFGFRIRPPPATHLSLDRAWRVGTFPLTASPHSTRHPSPGSQAPPGRKQTWTWAWDLDLARPDLQGVLLSPRCGRALRKMDSPQKAGKQARQPARRPRNEMSTPLSQSTYIRPSLPGRRPATLDGALA